MARWALLLVGCLCLMSLSFGSRVAAEEPTTTVPDDAQGLAFFEAKVRPVLVANCYRCHSAEHGKAEGGLQLDSRQGIRSGGDSGPAVVPGEPAESLLLTAISYDDPDLRMPPKAARLSKGVVQDLETWIRMGAPDPRVDPTGATRPRIDLESAQEFWSFRPLVAQEPPQTSDPSWARRPLDHFVLAGLEAAGLKPSPDAEPLVVLRRLHFDLAGLPPAPETVQRFLDRTRTDGLDQAIEAEVDRLLAAPSFGERWGRHWLDVARFGESSGKVANISFPYAWRYRDYVIDAVQADIPYDRFLIEQVAGDQLPYETEAERARLLIATGFLAIGPKNLEEADSKQFFADIVDEQIDSLTRAVLGSSLACARCHDHKFDPYSMEDYYALAGVFSSTKTYFGTYVTPANRVGGDPLPLPRVDGQQIYHASIKPAQVASLKQQLADLKKEAEAIQAAIARAFATGEEPGEIASLTNALRNFWQTGGVKGQLDKVDDNGQALPLAMGVLDADSIGDGHLYERGEVGRPGEQIARGVPRVFRFREPPAFPSDRSGRLELAHWLTHPDHPLTARVMANRIWHHLFGTGIVSTVDDFGFTGQRPSHPELLDQLAIEFVAQGWSVKKLVREVVLSRAYRQASTFRLEAFEQDPENRLLWRASKRRIDAESIRDAMLAVSGELDTTRPGGSLVARIGDRPISLIGLDKKLPKDLDGSKHRSVYLPVIRDRLPDVLELFDFAEPSLVTGRRETTNVPSQALYLMNSDFVIERAKALAERVASESDNPNDQARRAFELCFSRSPDETEARLGADFLQATMGDAPEPTAEVRRQLLTTYCQALLSTAEFRNLD
jgi:cytochrome c553